MCTVLQSPPGKKTGHLGLKTMVPVQTELLTTEVMELESFQHKYNKSWVFWLHGTFPTEKEQ